jgi:hypothetical protein
MRPLFAAPLLMIVCGLFAYQATAPRDAAPPCPAKINHVVLFKLKNPADAVELIHDCDVLARSVPGIVSAFAGKPLETGRSNVDGSYDVGFYVGFASEQDYAAYVDHAAHIEAVNKWKPRWQWIRIHDVIDEADKRP